MADISVLKVTNHSVKSIILTIPTRKKSGQFMTLTRQDGQNHDNKNHNKQNDQRHQVMHAWLQSVIPDKKFRVESLAGDASFRRYHRIYLENSTLENTTLKNTTESEKTTEQEETVYILMDAPPEQESIAQFVQVAELMANTLNVPDIIAKELDEGFLLLQDFGQVEFAHLLTNASEEEIHAHYTKAMKALLDLQSIEISMAEGVPLPYYDQALLSREMQLFTEWFLPYVGAELPVNLPTENALIWQALHDELIANILTQPQVIVHRDYHSRNLMLDRADADRLGVIDFQDAVIGSYTYDLVSLLRDAYVRWDEKIISQWLAQYWQMLPQSIQASRDFEQFYQDVTVMGVQRHLKVLGIFVRLSERDGKARYLADIPKVMDDLLYELQWLSEHGQGSLKPLAEAFLGWLEVAVLPAYLAKFVR